MFTQIYAETYEFRDRHMQICILCSTYCTVNVHRDIDRQIQHVHTVHKYRDRQLQYSINVLYVHRYCIETHRYNKYITYVHRYRDISRQSIIYSSKLSFFLTLHSKISTNRKDFQNFFVKGAHGSIPDLEGSLTIWWHSLFKGNLWQEIFYNQSMNPPFKPKPFDTL